MGGSGSIRIREGMRGGVPAHPASHQPTTLLVVPEVASPSLPARPPTSAATVDCPVHCGYC